jgi:hypothetical protein
VLKPEGFFILTVEILSTDEMRDPAHPHSFTDELVIKLVQESYNIVFKRKSRWIGIANYLRGDRAGNNNEELILVLNKRALA